MSVHVNRDVIHLSLNIYRNLHFQVLNKVKKEVKRIVWSQLAQVENDLGDQVKLTITLFQPDKKRRDLGNFCAVAQKFVDDALVEYGTLKDDDTNHLVQVTYKNGSIDKVNPRFELVYENA